MPPELRDMLRARSRSVQVLIRRREDPLERNKLLLPMPRRLQDRQDPATAMRGDQVPQEVQDLRLVERGPVHQLHHEREVDKAGKRRAKVPV